MSARKFQPGDKVRFLGTSNRGQADIKVGGVYTFKAYYGADDEWIDLDLSKESGYPNHVQAVHVSEVEPYQPSYRDEMLRTAAIKPTDPIEQLISLAALGLGGEAGECVDLAKKHLHHGVPFDREKMIKELGDVRWYLELMAYVCGVEMTEIERRNVEKLRKRYPDGFNTAASIAKADEQKDVA